jgi:Tol biopolymer transport system component
MKNIYILSVAFFILSLLITCTKRDESVGMDYLGQDEPGDSARIFASGTISTDAFEHSSPAFSPDGKTVLWAVMELPSWKSRILEMTFDDGRWSTSHLPSFSDTSASDISPSFSPDGRTLFFSSGRILPPGRFPEKGNVIWKVERNEKGWGTPVPLDSVISRSGDYAPSMSAKGNLYFTYGPFRSPDWNIFVASLRDNLSRPRRIDVINSIHYEDGPYIAPDESYLIFESDRARGLNGSIDLYISFRLENGEWGMPLNMGPTVNSKASERFASVSPDGKYLFFGSNRRQINGTPNFDIYWISSSIVDELKENQTGAQ